MQEIIDKLIEAKKIEDSCNNIYTKISDRNACKFYHGFFDLITEAKEMFNDYPSTNKNNE